MSKIVQKWDFKKHVYEVVEIDDECSLYEIDMEKVIKCANCGKKKKYGDCYTSKQYHNEYGFGYAVCEKCYNKEWRFRMLNEKFD